MEVDLACPYCGEPISLWLEADGGSSQSYVEDCAVCCRPMQVQVYVDGDGDASAQVQRLDD
ncbi:MAG: CPXCG motif-containing cysteine-rich protein [Polyangiales bacterium]